MNVGDVFARRVARTCVTIISIGVAEFLIGISSCFGFFVGGPVLSTDAEDGEMAVTMTVILPDQWDITRGRDLMQLQ